jgi:hypothetical protein
MDIDWIEARQGLIPGEWRAERVLIERQSPCMRVTSPKRHRISFVLVSLVKLPEK